MKLFELTFDGKKITVHREAEERLTGEQKYVIRLALIGCTAFLGFLYILFG